MRATDIEIFTKILSMRLLSCKLPQKESHILVNECSITQFLFENTCWAKKNQLSLVGRTVLVDSVVLCTLVEAVRPGDHYVRGNLS